jgi:hypothetical protein
MSAIIGTQQYLNYFNNPVGKTQGGIDAALDSGSVIGAIMAGLVSDNRSTRFNILRLSLVVTRRYLVTSGLQWNSNVNMWSFY